MRISGSLPLHLVSRSVIVVAVIGSAVALAGCAAETSPLRGAAKAVNFATDTPPPADFVGKARNPGAPYIRVDRELPTRPTSPRNVEQVKELEKSLEATRTTNAAAGAAAQAEGRTPPPTPPVAPPPIPED